MVNRWRTVVAAFLGVVAALVLYQLSVLWRAPAVDLMTVTRGPLSDSLAVTGTVEARTVAVAPKVPGRVGAVRVDVGTEVTAGQIVIELTSDELAARVDEAAAAVAAARARQGQAGAALALQRATSAARLAQAQAELAAAKAQWEKARAGARPHEREQAAARVAQAKVALDQARRELERVRELVGRGAVSPSALDAARAAADIAQAQYDAARQAQSLVEAGAQPEDVTTAEARVRQAEAALRAARAQLDATRIVAPISGTVVRKNVEVGELLAPGAAVLTIADLREIWVTVDLAAGDVAKVRLGQNLEVRSDAYPGRVFSAKVSELSRIADPRFGVGQAWSIRAKVALIDPERLLRPGVQVDISGIGILVSDAVLVPASAVVTRGDRTGVFLVDGNLARFRPVRVGAKTSKEIQVLEGVSPGDRIVASPGDALHDGARVRTR
jgi:RND family efflux transporter MFP subunit